MHVMFPSNMFKLVSAEAIILWVFLAQVQTHRNLHGTQEERDATGNPNSAPPSPLPPFTNLSHKGAINRAGSMSVWNALTIYGQPHVSINTGGSGLDLRRVNCS